MNQSKDIEVATLAGGCFWCLEAVFAELEGVKKVVSGYTGGKVANPSYRDVCTGKTGHAEAVQITFDPAIISYKDILEVFFQVHDLTTLNRQGTDVGTQYRSAIFYHNDEQKAIAEQTIEGLDAAKGWKSPIVTGVKPFNVFYPAEDYHRDYFRQNKSQPYCQAVIAPKMTRLRKHYSHKLKRNQ